jgi:hypothetical protein
MNKTINFSPELGVFTCLITRLAKETGYTVGDIFNFAKQIRPIYKGETKESMMLNFCQTRYILNNLMAKNEKTDVFYNLIQSERNSEHNPVEDYDIINK